ncbi:gastrula zinc finger protein XlCGF7.1-like [Schistocerca piceifrons]|uniref:gastrula zinc finger protein XlCGF7.1-like n=1 Tax=Schistocerca piceifrons TaxID=274613 RepID=UPI001F5FCB84|nr:gastrula zinc finger protein XlCGF7.1-like [Schistocerca piceifrons]XP_047108350.1 gastrula zinc finger protein XlCGF7.1-like [Schistocerca piceifrons]
MCETNQTSVQPQLYNCESTLVNASCQKSTKEKARPKPQTCKVCGKVLASASSYYVHMKLHSGDKPFHCKLCEASFSRKPYLEAHLRTHTGERPFQCNVCLKWFSQKSSLNTHKRAHTGERPYSCDMCGKKFAVKSYLTAHKWSHVVDMPLVCGKCNVTFTSKQDYALHERLHATGLNFECHVCGRTFAKDSYLIRHVNRVHHSVKEVANDPSGKQVASINSDIHNAYTGEVSKNNMLVNSGHPGDSPTDQMTQASEEGRGTLSSDLLAHSVAYNHFMVPC